MSVTSPPRWDLSSIFPSLQSAEFAAALDRAGSDLDSLADLFDSVGVRRRENPALDSLTIAHYDDVTDGLNDLLQQTRTLMTYVRCITTTDARDDEAKSFESLLNEWYTRLSQLETRYTAWVGTMDVEALMRASGVAREHEHSVRESRELAVHQMSEAEENLAAQLRNSGLTGWARLHGNMTSLLTAEVRGDRLPMSTIRGLGSHVDRETRRSAFDAEIAAWKTVEVPLAAALNGIKGFQHALRGRRGYLDAVEPTLTANAIDRPTLEAMQAACVESFPDFQRYLAAKARALGIPNLAWYDMDAPVGGSGKVWTWPEAEQFVLQNFGRYSDRLREFAARAFQENWTDAEPRVGKQGGAYCTGPLPGISRIMMNFDGSFTDVSTLAHELGHAYHNLKLRNRTPLQRATPSTLAETASLFCETLAFDSALGDATPEDRIALLDTSLQRDLQVVVDIHSRFLFESRVFDKRSQRDLTVAEFCDLMTTAQRETYGADVDPLHPYMWAVKGHYYGPTFYNYPYTFGLLFGIGLYALYRESPDAFRSRYDDLLSRTGMSDARTLAAEFGIDVTQMDFWRSSLDVIRAKVSDFEEQTRRR